ncbi:U4/U6 small nuclear ribonucleoprotein Prp3-like [Centruroides sculpturatus]|uniref:U4/U6 small nuclear ribonucleoprotein Prp3-like n=1 Tax=Centruroides sculpturatus TaxID=218467 RepID=UPI000C6D2E50|nr:U4/U6 small nuclear ribonucleoprotein Prp3-like [Centruroides sculpturatus]XP_023218248.1 U4/U6 small nuclear ribonucleoprotein Prp3-like [Centruroides sculpturatus]
MALSRRDLDDLKPWIDRTVQKFLGFREQTLVTAALNCLSSGYDKRKTTDKLSQLLEESKASKLADQLFATIDDLKIKNRSKRKTKEETENIEFKKAKFSDEATTAIPSPGQPSPGQLTALQIKEMMANAQRLIEERKKALSLKFGDHKGSVHDFSMLSMGDLTAEIGGKSSLTENKARIAELTAQIQARLANRQILFTADPNQLKAYDKSKPTPLILNAEGRTVDLSGKEVQLTHRVPTLKANIRAQRREQFKLNQEKVSDDISDQKFFDPRVSTKIYQRNKRSFRFYEKGKFEQQAQRLRTKCQLERLQQEIAQAAKKTGISSATKLALVTPKKEYKEGEVPEIEWWDSFIMKGESYDKVTTGSELEEEHFEGVTSLVEHPTQMKAPTDPLKPSFLPVYLTKKERKKLRRQNRRETWKEKQEKIRLGLEPPPEPKGKN